MCILKALDQEQVDFKKNKDLQQKVHKHIQQHIKEQKKLASLPAVSSPT